VLDTLNGFRGPNDPLWPLDALFGASEDGVEIGPQAVRGVPATRCRVTVDLARADAALRAGVSVPSGPYRSLSRLPAEVWLDADGLGRRISVSCEPAAAADAQVWSVVELWDYGVPVDITPPGPVRSWRRPRLIAWLTRNRLRGMPDSACAPAASSCW
jgi:hypothetical protein